MSILSSKGFLLCCLVAVLLWVVQVEQMMRQRQLLPPAQHKGGTLSSGLAPAPAAVVPFLNLLMGHAQQRHLCVLRRLGPARRAPGDCGPSRTLSVLLDPHVSL